MKWVAITAISQRLGMMPETLRRSRCQVFGIVPICAALTGLGVPIAPRTY